MPISPPDFVGSWIYDSELDTPEFQETYMKLLAQHPGNFFMHIESRVVDSEGNHKISGKIEDALGKATFEGEVGSGKIRFTKRYSEAAIRRGAANNRVEYEGTAVDNRFVGKYTVIDGRRMGEPCDWQGEFVMWAFSGPSRN